MSLPRLLGAVMGAAARRPLLCGLVVTALALAGGALALQLKPSAATDTLVGRSTDSFQATERYHERFGEDAVIVLVKGDLAKLVLTSDVQRLLGLEGCISGNAPRGVVPLGGRNGPCGRLAREKPVKVVFGPGTFINESVRQIGDQFAAQTKATQTKTKRAGDAAYKLAVGRGYGKAQARKFREQAQELVKAEFFRELLQLGLRYGLRDIPRLNDPDFVSQLVFDATRGAGVPKARFAYLFPNRNSALVQVRLKHGLSEEKRNTAIGLIREAIAMPEWKLQRGGKYVVTGAPVVVADLTDRISGSILALLIGALLVMALTLALVFRVALPLLPLAVAMGAAGITFGALSLIGAPLTMASIGVLPVLIGLGVDYAIQVQSRIVEARGAGERLGTVQAIARVAAVGAPTVAIAATATAAGFLALVLSPVPMVRGFGLLLVGGIAVAFACTLTLGVAVFVARAGAPAPRPLRLLSAWTAPAVRGAGDLLVRNRVTVAARDRIARLARGALAASTARPGRALAVGLILALAGWGLDTQTAVESDVQKLVPADLRALQDLDALQRSTGVGGQIDVVVRARDLSDPKVVGWMGDYQGALLKRYGYSAERGCGKAELCPAFSLPDLFRGEAGKRSRAEIKALLDAVPAYFSQGVITPDRKTATLAFGIRLMPLDRQQDVIEAMRERLDPPAGVSAELAGLPVLAAEANDRVASPWRRIVLLLAGLGAVALVLLAAFRSWRRALVPLVPIALATGWSALVLFALRIPLNPMSVTLGALVIAISTEFSVLLAERYRAERAAGHDPPEALARTYRSTGAAVLASGATAIAGFGVLVLSDIRMLRDFGLVTVVDLTVSLLGVLVVLPAVLLVAERGLSIPAPRMPRLRRPRLPRRRKRTPAGAEAG